MKKHIFSDPAAIAATFSLLTWAALAQPASPFNLTVSPAAKVIVQGGWQDFSIGIVRAAGYVTPVSIELRGAPTGITASYSRNPVPLSSSRMTVNVAPSVPLGTYRLVVHGQAETSVDVPVQVTVTGALPAPTVSIDTTLHPVVSSIPGADAAHPRTINCLADPTHQAQFVNDEVLVVTNDAARLDAFIKRWKATVVSVLPRESAVLLPQASYLMRIDSSTANLAALPQNMQKANPNVTGKLTFCDQKGMMLFAAAAEEAASGLWAGLNFLGQPSGTYLDGKAFESPTGPSDLNGFPYSANVFNWNHMNVGGFARYGVTRAWQALEFSGKLANSTTVAIIEAGGFGPNADFPLFNPTSLIQGQNPLLVRNPLPGSDGKPAPWHGTLVAQSLAGRANNNFGAAGTAGAGPNANLVLISASGDTGGLEAGLLMAALQGAKVVNISWGGEVPALATLFTMQGLDGVTQAIRDAGILIYAAAGNKGENVDNIDCFGACWEGTWFWPCEDDGVTCVGGLEHDSMVRHANSNFGSGLVGEVGTVNIWAPFQVMVGPDPDNPANVARWVGGTSFSSPYVAGVAAMVWATNPALTADQVEGFIFNTAAQSADPQVRNNRIVQADLAVMAALGDMPPVVTISSPLNNSIVGYGGLNQVKFTAVPFDFEDGPNCCKTSWSSDIDGPMGVGASINFVFATVGTRTITVTVLDSAGHLAQATVKVTAGNTPPSVTINKPSPQANLYKGVSYVFDGQGTDPNEPAFLLACSKLTWSTNVAGDPKLTGCNPVFQFATLGQRTIKLIGTDSQGVASIPAMVTVNVINVPNGAGPIYTITQPVDHSVFAIGEHSSLAYTVANNDNTLKFVEWRIAFWNTEIPVKVYPGSYWIPSDYLPKVCGESTGVLRLYVNGVLQGSVTVGVNYGSC